jgi:hypothetical protein
MIIEKTLIIPHSIPRTAKTTAIQNNATRILSDKGIEFTSFHNFYVTYPVAV